MTVKQKAGKWLVQCAIVVALAASAGVANASKIKWLDNLIELAQEVVEQLERAETRRERKKKKSRAEMTPAEREAMCREHRLLFGRDDFYLSECGNGARAENSKPTICGRKQRDCDVGNPSFPRKREYRPTLPSQRFPPTRE